MSSTFDPDMFMNSQTTDANDTTLVPVPVGDYPASVKEVVAGTAGDKPVLNVTWTINDQAARDATGMENPTVRQTIWLDIDEATGGLQTTRGKNVGLGKLRAALNQNQPGQPWAPGMLKGQAAIVKVTHRADKDDASIQYAQIAAVTAM